MDSVFLQCIAGPAFAVMILLLGSISVVREGHVGVAVLFGQYNRILRPGINFRIPFVERVFRSVSLQDRAAELEFHAVTSDRAKVNFKARIVYAVADGQEEAIMKAAFASIDERTCMQSLIWKIEGSLRSCVAGKLQCELLALPVELVDEVNAHVEQQLQDWGYHLVTLQIQKLALDEAIVRSMIPVHADVDARRDEGKALLHSHAAA